MVPSFQLKAGPETRLSGRRRTVTPLQADVEQSVDDSAKFVSYEVAGRCLRHWVVWRWRSRLVAPARAGMLAASI